MQETFLSHSAAETYALGMQLSGRMRPNTILCFFGELGAGKTTLIKGLAAGILGTTGDEVNSPTFTYLNIYKGKRTLYHFDLYRLRDADEFLSMGFDEVFDAGGVTCIEWSEKIESVIPDEAIRISISHAGGDQREIVLSSKELV